jgi:hypothetical protein
VHSCVVPCTCPPVGTQSLLLHVGMRITHTHKHAGYKHGKCVTTEAPRAGLLRTQKAADHAAVLLGSGAVH